MLNLSQRLILGCALAVCLMAWLVVAAHNGLAAAGQLRFAWVLVAAVVVVEAGTVYFVLRPIHLLARDRWSFNSPTPCCNPSSSPSS